MLLNSVGHLYFQSILDSREINLRSGPVNAFMVNLNSWIMHVVVIGINNQWDDDTVVAKSQLYIYSEKVEKLQGDR
jgi:hypothetical protein